jgi:excisionase family DNA binding protein
MNTSTEGLLVDAAHVAQRLGVPRSWVTARARAGDMPHVRIGRYTRFDMAEVDEWVRQGGAVLHGGVDREVAS